MKFLSPLGFTLLSLSHTARGGKLLGGFNPFGGAPNAKLQAMLARSRAQVQRPAPKPRAPPAKATKIPLETLQPSLQGPDRATLLKHAAVFAQGGKFNQGYKVTVNAQGLCLGEMKWFVQRGYDAQRPHATQMLIGGLYNFSKTQPKTQAALQRALGKQGRVQIKGIGGILMNNAILETFRAFKLDRIALLASYRPNPSGYYRNVYRFRFADQYMEQQAQAFEAQIAKGDEGAKIRFREWCATLSDAWMYLNSADLGTQSWFRI